MMFEYLSLFHIDLQPVLSPKKSLQRLDALVAKPRDISTTATSHS
jgi:hypothetical protein